MASAPDPGTRPFAVVDIDGVLADVRHRLRHVDQRPKDWTRFFAAAADDPVLPEGAAVAERLATDHELVYLTGRPESLRHVTETWLRAAELPDGRLLMRRAGDRRAGRLVKVETLKRLARERPVQVLVDDDPLVVTDARAAGFTVLAADWMPRDDGVDTLFDVQEIDGRT